MIRLVLAIGLAAAVAINIIATEAPGAKPEALSSCQCTSSTGVATGSMAMVRMSRPVSAGPSIRTDQTSPVCQKTTRTSGASSTAWWPSDVSIKRGCDDAADQGARCGAKPLR